METFFHVNKNNLRIAEQVERVEPTHRGGPDATRDKKHKRKKDERQSDLFGDDVTDVSVDALIRLLSDLLNKAKPQQPADDSDPFDLDEDGQDEPPQPREKMEKIAFQSESHKFIPPNPQRTSKAISAYQHSAEISAPTTGDQYSGDNHVTQDIDVGRVESLLNKARKLKANEIDHISFVEGKSFLESLEKAVDKAIRGIS